jgi:hypothetical protein
MKGIFFLASLKFKKYNHSTNIFFRENLRIGWRHTLSDIAMGGPKNKNPPKSLTSGEIHCL